MIWEHILTSSWIIFLFLNKSRKWICQRFCPHTHEWEWVGLWVRCREAPEWMFWRHSPHASDDHQVIYSLVIVQRWADCTTSRTSSIWSRRRLWSRILGTKTLNHRGVGTNTIWNVFPTELIQKGLLSDPALVTRFPELGALADGDTWRVC